MNKPLLIVVTGRAGAGKTTFARILADQMYLPLVSRDALKEGYVNTAGKSHNDLPKDTNGIVSNTFFKTVDLLLGAGVSLVVEAAFQHKVWAPRLTQLQNIARVRIVICTLDPQLARTRYLERGTADPLREHYHGDQVMALTRQGQEPPIQPYVPPDIEAPTWQVDTTADYKPTISELIAVMQEPQDLRS